MIGSSQKLILNYLKRDSLTFAGKIIRQKKTGMKFIFPYKVLNGDFLKIGLWYPVPGAFNSDNEYKIFIAKNGSGSIDNCKYYRRLGPQYDTVLRWYWPL